VPSAEKVQPVQRQSTRHIKFWSEILPKCTCTVYICSQFHNTSNVKDWEKHKYLLVDVVTTNIEWTQHGRWTISELSPQQ